MIRSYQKEDEHKINKLFHEVFGKERTVAEWKWKYIDNILNKTIITLDDENGDLAGHVALVPFEAKWFNNEVVFGARNDTMVSSRYRGKGIYGKLNKQMIEDAEQAGVDYLYGYPAEKAKELFIRYTGAKEIASIPRLIRFNKLSTLLTSRFSFLKYAAPLMKGADFFLKPTSFKSVQGMEVREIIECGPEFDKLWEQAKQVAPILLKRDAKFLNWRFHRHPERSYQMFGLFQEGKLSGYVVIHRAERSFGNGRIVNGTIVDMLAAGGSETWEQLVSIALDQLKDADTIQTWALTHSLYFSTLKKYRFVHKDNPMPLVGKSVNEKLTDDGIENWYITPADVDSF